MDKLWVFCSFNDEYENNMTQSLLSKVCEFTESNDVKLELICMVQSDEQPEIPLKQLSNLGVSKVNIYRNIQFDMIHIQSYIIAMQKLIKQHQPNYLLFTGTAFHKNIAAQLATAMEFGLTAECTEYLMTENNDFIQIRPTFDGNTYAHIITDSSLKMSTALPVINTFEEHKKNCTDIKVVETDILLDNINHKGLIQIKNQGVVESRKLHEYDIVLAGGMGLKSKENFEKLQLLAKKSNMGIAATRPVVEMGWAEKSCLIGMSGQCISPKLYIAFGISGSLQHIEGIKGTEKIISINNDKDAPLHAISNYIIIEDAADMINSLLDKTQVDI